MLCAPTELSLFAGWLAGDRKTWKTFQFVKGQRRWRGVGVHLYNIFFSIILLYREPDIAGLACAVHAEEANVYSSRFLKCWNAARYFISLLDKLFDVFFKRELFLCRTAPAVTQRVEHNINLLPFLRRCASRFSLAPWRDILRNSAEQFGDRWICNQDDRVAFWCWCDVKCNAGKGWPYRNGFNLNYLINI